MDDGSRSVEESLAMLEEESRQGVCCIVLTPHFCAFSDTPGDFLERRKYAAEKLRAHFPHRYPVLIEGAEVQYFSGITVMEELGSLCIAGTDLLLLEMPCQKWSSRVIDDVLELNSTCRVIIAHIERCINRQPVGTLEELVRNQVLIQSNAEFFLNPFTGGKALRQLKNGFIHLLGSDCHRMEFRPPRLGECIRRIEKKLGEDETARILRRGADLLPIGMIPIK